MAYCDIMGNPSAIKKYTRGLRWKKEEKKSFSQTPKGHESGPDVRLRTWVRKGPAGRVSSSRRTS